MVPLGRTLAASALTTALLLLIGAFGVSVASASSKPSAHHPSSSTSARHRAAVKRKAAAQAKKRKALALAKKRKAAAKRQAAAKKKPVAKASPKVPATTPSAAATVSAAALPAPSASPVLAPPAPAFSAPAAAPPAATTPSDEPDAPDTPVQQPLADELRGLKLVNYYPADHAWQDMWNDFDAAGFATDAGRIAALGGNAIRLIVFPSVTGFPTPSPSRVAQLATAVHLAEAAGLRVQLTLFDYWNGYADIAGSKAWVAAMLAPLAGDDGVAFVEIRNEIDLQDPGAVPWMRAMLPYVRQVSGRPVTVSVTGSSGVAGLTQLKQAVGDTPPDFYSFHYYTNPAQVGAAYAVLGQARAAVAPAPLLIGETGTPSEGWSASPIDGEYEQSEFYRAVGAAASALGLGVPAPWMLNDLTPQAAPAAVGTLDSGELNMGLFHVDGTPKPVATAVEEAFRDDKFDSGFNGGFEQAGADDPTLPSGWRVWWPDQAQFARDTTVSHGGTASVRISASGGDASGVPSFYTTPPTPIVQPGKAYVLSAWSRAAAAQGRDRLAIVWFDAQGQYLSQTESAAYPDGTTGWSQRTVQATAPVGAAYVQIHLKSSNEPGTVWFDDATFAAA